MGSSLDRLESDRNLFEPDLRDVLKGMMQNGNPLHLAESVVKALEMQIVTEEIARERGIEITTEDASEYMSRNSVYFQDQVDNAIRLFIASILSREGS